MTDDKAIETPLSMSYIVALANVITNAAKDIAVAEGATSDMARAAYAWVVQHLAASEPEAGPESEQLGRMVREVWIAWAHEQPSPKPSWLVPWDDLAAPDQDVDMRIGRAIAAHVRAPLLAANAALRAERDAALNVSCPACGANVTVEADTALDCVLRERDAALAEVARLKDEKGER